jgi:antitoxin (DNA-binding transcriptional repressor) of toxin-antitoxin stability system
MKAGVKQVASVTIHKAKTDLAKLIAGVEAVEEITIMRREKPAAGLVASEVKATIKRVGGSHPELASIPDDFFFMPPDEEDLGFGKAESEGPT